MLQQMQNVGRVIGLTVMRTVCFTIDCAIQLNAMHVDTMKRRASLLISKVW